MTTRCVWSLWHVKYASLDSSNCLGVLFVLCNPWKLSHATPRTIAVKITRLSNHLDLEETADLLKLILTVESCWNCALSVPIPLSSSNEPLAERLEPTGDSRYPSLANLLYTLDSKAHIANHRLTKNAGGQPPALGGPSIRRIQIFYIMCRATSHQFCAKFFKRSLLETRPATEEFLVSCTGMLLVITNGGGFETTDIVRCLSETILACRCRSVRHRFLPQDVAEGFMNGPVDGSLSSVVVHLYFVKRLQRLNVVKQKSYQLLSHCDGNRSDVIVVTRPERKNFISDWQMPEKDAKRREQTSASFQSHVLIITVTIHQWLSVEGDIRKSLSAQGLLISSNRFGDVEALIVKNKGSQIMRCFKVIASGFINEDTELFGHWASFLIKKPGKTSPALGSPLLRGDCFYLYHEPKHSFNYTKIRTYVHHT